MAARIDFIEEHELAVGTLSGRVDGNELITAIRSLLFSDIWEPGFSILWDGRRIRELVVTPEDVGALADLTGALATRRGTGRTAVVIIRDIDLMIAELLQHTLEITGSYRTFANIDDAASWLEVPRDELAGAISP